jgi:hypothetical protein
MFKGFASKRVFNGFPENSNFGNSNRTNAYGLSGCSLWLDPSDIINVSDLAPIVSWRSKIGSWAFAQQTSANQPRFLQSYAGFNNHPAVDFYTGPRNMILPTGWAIPFGSNWTIAFISQCSMTVASSQRSLFDDGSELSGGLISTGDFRNDGTGLGIYNRAGTSSLTTVFSSGVEDAANHITVIRAGTSGQARILVDGIEENTGNWIPNSKWSRLGAQNPISTGSQILGEILIFSLYLTDLEMDNLSNELNMKYAIY